MTVSFYRAPYLVDIDVVQGKRVLMLDDISENAEAWRDADVLSFNSGHWWTHTGSMQGYALRKSIRDNPSSFVEFALKMCAVDGCRWDYMGESGRYYEDMDRTVAFQRGLTTWANWVDLNLDQAKTRVFFQSMSPTHYRYYSHQGHEPSLSVHCHASGVLSRRAYACTCTCRVFFYHSVHSLFFRFGLFVL